MIGVGFHVAIYYWHDDTPLGFPNGFCYLLPQPLRVLLQLEMQALRSYRFLLLGFDRQALTQPLYSCRQYLGVSTVPGATAGGRFPGMDWPGEVMIWPPSLMTRIWAVQTRLQSWHSRLHCTLGSILPALMVQTWAPSGRTHAYVSAWVSAACKTIPRLSTESMQISIFRIVSPFIVVVFMSGCRGGCGRF